MGESAFYDCRNLTSFSAQYSSPQYFNRTNLSIAIPDKAFYNCESLYHFKCWISSKVGEQAFYNCKKLPSIVIDTQSGVGQQAFYGCTELERLMLTPNTRQPAGDEEFGECNNLKDIYLVRSIWAGNHKINSNTFPSSTFQSCTLHFADDHVYADEYMVESVYNNGWGLFAKTQFDYCDYQQQLIYSKGNCYKVISGDLVGYYDTVCVIPKEIDEHYVTRIGPKAFKDNQWVTSIEIPITIKRLDSLAFYNTPNLESIYVRRRVPIRYSNALWFSKNARRRPFEGIDFDKCILYVPKGCWHEYATANEWKRFKHIVETDDEGGLFNPRDEHYSGHGGNTSDPLGQIIEFDDPLTEDICIEHWDKNGTDALSKREAAAANNLDLYFRGKPITSFCELEYFTGLTAIPYLAFENCAELDSITIPENVTTIYSKAFSGCNQLKKVFTRITTPFAFNENVFTETAYQQATLVVPVGTKALYQQTDGWKNFVNIVEEGETIEPALPGDLTGDSEVDGMDLVALVNVIMGQSAMTSGADLNGDGEVDGMDYVALVNIIMGTAGSRNKTDEEHHINIGMEPLTIAAGESRDLAITLQNADLDVTMAQMDLTLPEGLTLTGDYDLSSRTTERNHQLYMSGNGQQHRLMIASPRNAVLTGTEGTILRLTLTADDSFEGGDIVLSNVLCASPSLQSARQEQAVLHLSGTNGIVEMHNSQFIIHNTFYSLSGQRLRAPRKGVNIMGGKKIIIK